MEILPSKNDAYIIEHNLQSLTTEEKHKKAHDLLSYGNLEEAFGAGTAVGIAYIQELRFALYVERLQAYLEKTLDAEFKRFLRQNNIQVDEEMYELKLPEPSNYGKYRQYELDSQLLSSYGSADGNTRWDARMYQKRYPNRQFPDH